MSLSEPLEIPIQTLTPVWTGDADIKTSYLRATSFLGGLRFWGEALLRSLGGQVCDITGDNRCVHDPDKGKEACDACRIFGCTGLGRSFALRVKNDRKLKDKAIGKITLSHDKDDGGKKDSTWYLTAAGKDGAFSLMVTPMRPAVGGRFELDPVVLAALSLQLRWGTLGAKDQYGYGLVRGELPPWVAAQIQNWLSAGKGGANDHGKGESDLVSLQDFFFFCGTPQKKNYGPKFNFPRDVPFEIRYQTRAALRTTGADSGIRHYFCGDLRDEQASKFNLALHGGAIYGWGWFPRNGIHHGQRERCLTALHQALGHNCREVRWKEFGGVRDTCDSARDWQDYLRELLEQSWRS